MRPLLALLRCLLMLLAGLPMAHAADDFLDPEIAFRLRASVPEAQRIELRFDIAPGYYLYRDKLSVDAPSARTSLGEPQIPKGQVKFDENFQKDVETLRDAVTLVVPIVRGNDAPFKIVVGSQGCADKGLCYPPMQRTLMVEPQPGGAMRIVPLSDATTPFSAAVQTSSFDAALGSRDLLAVVGAFFMAGVLLSLTPCVLPMLPILSSIIVGQAGPVSRQRGLMLAVGYSMGMAIVYTALGMAAGMLGEGLAAGLQNAWVLGAFALLLVGLSLSMFGVYELRMPSAVQSRLTSWSHRFKGGHLTGVFAIGALSALIVSPCVAAPLAGALLYIGQTRDMMLGGAALFALACGMSVPLLLVGLSAGSLLPRAGPWMVRVKHVFGVLLLGVALWIVSPLLPGASTAREAALPFTTIDSVGALRAAIRASDRPVLVDFYADWCVACKEMEAFTFSDAKVREVMSGMTLVRIDVTANTDEHKALLREHRLFGPPAVLVFTPAGQEITAARVIGFENAQTFVARLRQSGI